ncbi:MAG: (2Fe-2S)-binding protein [Deltaproteobacteria bacterium]|nr:(2Fe-2S)-binding protein [Deltaproteobacteria bacterium]
MSRHLVTLTVNGAPVTREVEAHRTLLEVLRDGLDLIGAKEGCGAGECGACTVLLDGMPVRACLVLAVEADGCAVATIEGLAAARGPDPIQQAFIDAGATQCGYCIPGFVLAARALLDRRPDPTDDDIVRACGGHLCRCTGYHTLFEAVRLAARRRAAG